MPTREQQGQDFPSASLHMGGAHQRGLPMGMTLAGAPRQQVPAPLLSSPRFTDPQPLCRAALTSGPALEAQGQPSRPRVLEELAWGGQKRWQGRCHASLI